MMRLFLLACLSGLVLVLTGCNGAANGNTLIPTPTPTPTSVPTPTPTPTPLAGNQAALVVDNGPSGLSANTISLNVPYVSVTVCPAGTGTCTTVDHVLVDTGSTGLRIMASALGNLSFTPQTTPATASQPNQPLAECYKFADGFVWGSVASADITIGSETANGVAIHIMGDPNYPTVPTGCSSGGTNESTVAAFGANGVLGVANMIHDCGDGATGLCTSAPNADYYYGCSTQANCQATTLPQANQILNPVSLFAVDNNGVVITMPSLGSNYAASSTGVLTFGIGTQTNNAIGTATVYPVNLIGLLPMALSSTTYANSFFDTGSNLIFLPSGFAAQCTTPVGFFCPNTSVTANITVNAGNSPTSQISLSIGNPNAIPNGYSAANNVGGVNSFSNSLDIGFPFNYGRTVYTGFNSGSTPGYVAF